MHSFTCQHYCCISASHERFSWSLEHGHTHIMVLWARQPLSNYCRPSQALLRHALNFAQDRWEPQSMQQSQADLLLTAAACVNNVIPVAVTRLKMKSKVGRKRCTLRNIFLFLCDKYISDRDVLCIKMHRNKEKKSLVFFLWNLSYTPLTDLLCLICPTGLVVLVFREKCGDIEPSFSDVA